jgi:hypothetical protein
MWGLVALGFWGLGSSDVEVRISAYILIPICGLTGMLFMAMVFGRSSYLRLDENGFTVKMWFRRYTVPWDHVASLSPGSTGADDVVLYVLRDEHRGNRMISGMARGLTQGNDGMVVDYYGMGAGPLAALMTEYLQAYCRPSP